MKDYICNDAQLFGVEEHRLCGGKGDGMRLFEVNNGHGINFTISADRAGDISRLSFNAKNIGFFAPCGYVAPCYYDDRGLGFLKSFTAGFLTTCGFSAVGGPCVDEGEELGLHGNISHQSAQNVLYWIDDSIHVKLIVPDASLFGRKIVLTREYVCSLDRNEIIINDCVKNIGTRTEPYMVLYHFNIGYPLLSEKSVLAINSKKITPRNEVAERGLATALEMHEPRDAYVEQCFYHDMSEGVASIYNPDIKTKLTLEYNTEQLPFFTQWKMLGRGEYVLGLEPGNCTPDGRDVMRKNGTLAFLEEGQEAQQTIKIKLEEK